VLENRFSSPKYCNKSELLDYCGHYIGRIRLSRFGRLSLYTPECLRGSALDTGNNAPFRHSSFPTTLLDASWFLYPAAPLAIAGIAALKVPHKNSSTPESELTNS
jgi:hypothetical protein